MTDGRCKYGPRAKREMIALHLEGKKARWIGRKFGCSPTTVTTAIKRWNEASEPERADGSWSFPRKPIPGSCPWALSAEVEQQILRARERTGRGPMQLSVLCGGRHRSSIGKVLRRHGVSRAPKTPRPKTKRYEWAEPGALLHIDALRLAKFDRPGHFATGQRAEEHKTRKAGDLVVVGVVDDHTRLAYCELHPAENKHAVSVTLTRAAAWMREQGCGPVEAVMSDNAKCYGSFAFQAALNELDAKHITTPAYTPRWNGKVERFFGTAKREWSHGRTWPNSTRRDRALSSWLRYYNRRRPHTAAGGRAPITRVHQVREQDT